MVDPATPWWDGAVSTTVPQPARPPAFVPLAPDVPAIAVPVQAGDVDELLALARAAVAAGAEVLEWRIDAIEGAAVGTMPDGAARPDLERFPEAVARLLRRLRATVGAPVLATYRSRDEGGPGVLDDDGYRALLLALVAARADAVDVELSRPAALAEEVARCAHEAGIAVVGSSHDFTRTPPDLDDRFAELARRGSDVLKVAATPQDAADVLRLLTAAVHARATHGRAVLPVSMGRLGVLSRVAGGLWRAPVTFAAVGRGSAPGQLGVAEVTEIQRVLAGERGIATEAG